MIMHNPPHPGEILKEDIIEALNLSVTKTAEHLQITRKHLSNVCNGHNGISADLALRLEAVFGAPKAPAWLEMQAAYDLWKAKEKVDKRHLEAFNDDHFHAKAYG